MSADIFERLEAGEFDGRAKDWGEGYRKLAERDRPPTAAQISAEIKAFSTALDRVQKCIESMHPETLRELYERYDGPMAGLTDQDPRDYDGPMADLTDAIFFLQAHRKGLHSVKGPRKGPDPKKEARNGFVRRCALLYKSEGGRPSFTGDNEYRTPFQRFVEGMAERGGVPVQGIRRNIEQVLRGFRKLSVI